MKAIEIANFPALAFAAWVVTFADLATDLGDLGKSWVRAWVFLAAASLQWLVLGRLLTQAQCRRKEHRAAQE